MASTPAASAAGRIIFPLDFKSLDEAARHAALLKGRVGVFKIGLELFTASGPEAVRAVKAAAPTSKIFLDLKLHDIPATVNGAAASAASLGVDFLTVHADGGRKMLEAAVEAARGRTAILAVTVLTSLGPEELIETGVDPGIKDPIDLVLMRARIARAAGCAGVVSSPREVGAIKKEFGAGLITVTPGIRSSADPPDDQRRVMTAFEAVKNGADYLVIGRPIRNAKDPAKAADEMAGEIARALSEMR